MYAFNPAGFSHATKRNDIARITISAIKEIILNLRVSIFSGQEINTLFMSGIKVSHFINEANNI